LIDWAPIERLVADIHPGETGRPPILAPGDVQSSALAAMVWAVRSRSRNVGVSINKVFFLGGLVRRRGGPPSLQQGEDCSCMDLHRAITTKICVCT
jgi:hypothetical protein